MVTEATICLSSVSVDALCLVVLVVLMRKLQLLCAYTTKHVVVTIILSPLARGYGCVGVCVCVGGCGGMGVCVWVWVCVCVGGGYPYS